jgi:hypothetical protein
MLCQKVPQKPMIIQHITNQHLFASITRIALPVRVLAKRREKGAEIRYPVRKEKSAGGLL